METPSALPANGNFLIDLACGFTTLAGPGTDAQTHDRPLRSVAPMPGLSVAVIAFVT